MQMKYIDIHSHIHEREFEKDLEAVLSRMRQRGVAVITVGTHLASSKKAVALAEEHTRMIESGAYPDIWATVGVHPTDVATENVDDEAFAKMAAHPRVVAIGECGLDYYRAKNLDDREKKRQRDIFEQQIELAVEADKPLMLHCRSASKPGEDGSAHAEAIDILKSKKRDHGGKLRGNVHFFTDTIETAQKYFDLDFTISFTGVITFTSQYDDVVRYAPATHLMTETDCPFASPAPYRGQRNEPAYVVEIAKHIALLRGEPEELIAEQLVMNAQRVFKLAQL